jgi:hypothetical protein
MMVQFIANNQSNNNDHNINPPPVPKIDMLARFPRFLPKKFSSAAEPMVANDWPKPTNDEPDFARQKLKLVSFHMKSDQNITSSMFTRQEDICSTSLALQGRTYKIRLYELLP